MKDGRFGFFFGGGGRITHAGPSEDPPENTVSQRVYSRLLEFLKALGSGLPLPL